ncbi:4a-hydroxytetrahydrobiopterin dehydratase [Streptomyces avicenniae]|uniref:4a-hydroxytetrahydrobiopterin dehydratase n=1 Tax=Streptomyces avicenniae TaxID=500153 RepID=UPI00069C51CC|nr:4a-hydroxytetrahydrobiopterin dehydratase [Streptomyces avicenniae]
MATPLTADQLDAALTGLPGWSVENGDLTAVYRVTRDQLPALYAAVARAEDSANHHARITVLYTSVTFALNTHDAGGAITELDTDLAAQIDTLARAHGAQGA